LSLKLRYAVFNGLCAEERDNLTVADRKRKVKEIAYHQFKEFLVVFLYLWLIFALFSLHKSIILAEAHIEFTAFGLGFVNALALAKVMMVARELHLADHFKERPLIYPTLLKSFVFALLLVIFRIIEEVAVRLYHGKTLEESLSAGTDQSAKIVLSSGLIMFVMLIPFFGFTELSRHFGEGRLGRLFLRSRRNWLADEPPMQEAATASPSDGPVIALGNRD
jgi:hypothetical protein